ncbi:MAG: methyltransferase [Clostridia bacterium]|nr:methyltransferase [Clostridia bacterium]
MNKVLVNVYIPILNRSYDIFIPTQSQIFEVTELIKRAISELSEGQFIPSRDTVLARKTTGEILDINGTVFELEIGNGTKLMLI